MQRKLFFKNENTRTLKFLSTKVIQNQLAQKVIANVGFLKISQSNFFLGVHKVAIIFFQSDFVVVC